jgi:hypothetical protein
LEIVSKLAPEIVSQMGLVIVSKIGLETVPKVGFTSFWRLDFTFFDVVVGVGVGVGVVFSVRLISFSVPFLGMSTDVACGSCMDMSSLRLSNVAIRFEPGGCANDNCIGNDIGSDDGNDNGGGTSKFFPVFDLCNSDLRNVL